MKVNISWLPLTPYWMEEKRPGPNGTEARTYTGREYRIMENIGSILNFSLNPLPFIGAEAVRKRLITREAFLWPVNLPVLPHMLDLFDISFFLEPSTLAFSMVKPSMKATWQSLYYPLRVEMNRSGKDKGPDPWLVMKQVLGTLLDEAIPGQLPLRSTTRVVLTAWLLFSFIVGTVYRSNLTASLTVVKDPPRIKSFAGLVDAGTKQVHCENYEH
ncbi:hypothetical protein E2C01_048235 [Portunus trituberculatus]|uniref:Ionotropic glutamate receptor C-terminal domain-containing protein n=1 Tax=Portunus trituberculatus TaxID=210409 RepID=A0A5B7GAA1_PORTR|nr:hypothetical protein [Portunus trituberculatus]